MSPLTLIFPPDRPGDATYASLAAQVEAGCAHIVQERRVGRDRRAFMKRRLVVSAREHGRRKVARRRAQRRQAAPLAVRLPMVVTP